MSKVQTLSGQQRLRQLAKRQLGSELTAAKVNGAMPQVPAAEPVDATRVIDQHSLLTTRAGLTMSDEGRYQTVTERAARRLQMRQEQQQLNLEKVMALALEYCSEQQSAQDVDPDWFQFYCELVQDISTQNMQKLWAKILAAEISNPGSFSLKTLSVLKQMSFKDAVSLQLAASLSCRTRSLEPAHIYFGYVQQGSVWRWLTGKSRGMLNLSQFGLSYPQILNLIDLGLLHQTEIESGALSKNQQLQWIYQQQLLQGTVARHGVVLQYYKFTTTGAELLPLLSTAPNYPYWLTWQLLLAEVMSLS